jgi:3-ketosteroid 9alpha-monooxygenase subunit B
VAPGAPATRLTGASLIVNDARQSRTQDRGGVSPMTQRIKHIPVVVSDVIQETPDTVTLLLDAGDDPRDYKAGQYVSIDPHQFAAIAGYASFLEDSKGRKEPPRAYSMCSTPDERYLAITIKEELYEKGKTKYPPLLSPFLVYHKLKGARMEVTGYAGAYVLPERIGDLTDHLVHLCAGSGSVPNVSIIKAALLQEPRIRHTFLYSNKTWNDIIYRDLLAELEARHPDRLRVVHALTREPEAFGYTERVRRGRVSTELIAGLAGDLKAAIFYACGPAVTVWEKRAAKAEGREPSPRFMESVHASLQELGIPKERFKEEAFG